MVQIHTISDDETINKTDIKEATKKNQENTKKAMEKGNLEVNNDDNAHFYTPQIFAKP